LDVLVLEVLLLRDQAAAAGVVAAIPAKRAMVRSGNISAKAAMAPTIKMPAVKVMAWA
jgi:hypothetical protein